MKNTKMIIPLRVSRAMFLTLGSSLLCPGHELEAIAISEAGSTLLPVLNVNNLSKMASFLLALSYAPFFGATYLKIWNETRHMQQRREFVILLCANMILFYTNLFQ